MYNRRKLILALTVIFTLNIMIIALAQRADAVTYAKGSSGETVREIQQLLLDWGYYSGEVDGIFGSRTAVHLAGPRTRWSTSSGRTA